MARCGVVVSIIGKEAEALGLYVFTEVGEHINPNGYCFHVQPQAGLQAITTPKGKIEVSWKTPTADTTLEPDSPQGQFKPSGYVVLYKPEEAQAFISRPSLT
ncbi:hypothetical protein CEXT_276861 [Caerostris extrusa]|uniref:Uncharacterized protein n=1 Tax=Caerostris extrusa TaxID=172846 RepID=A0AAV4NIF9_CAEEX|nr:hypothetical protein CEXT_276861 [Caerostris extrusa]